MIIEVYRFNLATGPLVWHGNLTHGIQIRYAYQPKVDYTELED